MRPSTIPGPVIDWCPDDDSRDNVIAPRNVLAALWAGRPMGHSGPFMTGHAAEFHLSDEEVSGDADVVAEIAGGFHREVLRQLQPPTELAAGSARLRR